MGRGGDPWRRICDKTFCLLRGSRRARRKTREIAGSAKLVAWGYEDDAP